jgi:hypothetical protein
VPCFRRRSFVVSLHASSSAFIPICNDLFGDGLILSIRLRREGINLQLQRRGFAAAASTIYPNEAAVGNTQWFDGGQVPTPPFWDER